MQVVRQRRAGLVDRRAAAASELASSTSRASRKAARDPSVNSGDHTTCTSTAGSPMHAEPQSTMPHSRPSRTRQFPSRSPCTHTDGPVYGGAASASSQTASGGGGVDQVARMSMHDARRPRRIRVTGRARFWAGGAPISRRSLELANDLGEVEGKVTDRRIGRARHLRPGSSGAPPTDRVAVGGFTDGDGLGHATGKVRGEAGQPHRLRARSARRPVNAGKTDHEVGAQAPDGVVGTPRLTTIRGKVGDVRHLRPEEIADEFSSTPISSSCMRIVIKHHSAEHGSNVRLSTFAG